MYLTRPLRQYLWNPLRKRTSIEADNPIAYTTAHYRQFMSGQVIQKWIFIFSILLVVPFVRNVLTYRDSEVDDLKPRRIERGRNPEDSPNDLYLSEVEAVPYGGRVTGVTKQFPQPNDYPEEPAPVRSTRPVSGIEDATPDGEEVQTITLSGDEDEESEPEPAPVPPKTQKKKPSAPKATAPKPVVAAAPDYCTLLRKTSGWIVQDNFYTTRENADLRSKTLRDKGLTAVTVGRSCIEKGSTGFIVWVGGIHSDEDKAKAGRREYEALLRKHRLYTNKLLIRKL